MIIWVVVAHRAGARILAHEAPEPGLMLVQEIEHPTGRMQNREITSDSHGRPRFGQHGSGGATYTDDEDAHAHSTRMFAKSLAERIETGRLAKEFDQLVLVAEPGFLGILTAELSPSATALVRTRINKDFHQVSARDLETRLEGTLPAT